MGLIAGEIWKIELETESLDLAKARLEMASVSSIFPTFSHAFSNAI
jgi:hypothetical protein